MAKRVSKVFKSELDYRKLEFRRIEKQEFSGKVSYVAWFVTDDEGTLECFVNGDVRGRLESCKKGTDIWCKLSIGLAPLKDEYFNLIDFMSIEDYDKYNVALKDFETKYAAGKYKVG